MKAKYVFFTILFLLGLGLDQATKIWARGTLKPMLSQPAPEKRYITVIDGYFDMHYSENPGSAFGFLSKLPPFMQKIPGARHLLFVVGLICLGVVGAWMYKIPASASWLGAKLGLLAGGAVGNMVDRAQFGKVTDFIVWKISDGKGGFHQWPTFNIADAALVIGVVLLLLDWPRDAVFKEQAPQAST